MFQVTRRQNEVLVYASNVTLLSEHGTANREEDNILNTNEADRGNQPVTCRNYLFSMNEPILKNGASPPFESHNERLKIKANDTRFAQITKHDIYMGMCKLEKQFPSVRQAHEEGRRTKRILVPSYLRPDQPNSKFIIRADGLCSGWGRNKLIKPADQLLQELERHRIPKLPRRPRKKKKKRGNRSSLRTGKNGRRIVVPAQHRSLMENIVLGEENLVLSVASPSRHHIDHEVELEDITCNDTGKTRALWSSEPVKFSLSTRPQPSSQNKKAEYMAHPTSHCASVLNLITKDAIGNSSTGQHSSPKEIQLLKSYASKEVVTGSPWSSLPVQLKFNSTVGLSDGNHECAVRTSNSEKNGKRKTNNLAAQASLREQYSSAAERLEARVETTLRDALVDLNDGMASESRIRSSNDIIKLKVSQLKCNTTDGKSTYVKIRELAQEVMGKGKICPQPSALGGKDFIEKNKALRALNGTSKLKKNILQRDESMRRALEIRDEIDRHWAENVKKKAEERMFRIRTGVREQEDTRRKQQWLSIISLNARSNYLFYVLLSKNKRLWGIKVIQRAWRKYQLKGKGQKYWKTMWRIKRWMRPLLVKFRMRIKHRNADIMKRFLDDHKDADAILTSIKKFRFKIMNTQRKFRAWSSITKCRVDALTKLWTRTEAEMLSNSIDEIKKSVQIRAKKKLCEGFTKKERSERSKQALKLAGGKSGNVMRIEKHLAAMDEAKDEYDKHLIASHTKSAFPKYIVKQALVEYLRGRRRNHGQKILEMRLSEAIRQQSENEKTSTWQAPTSITHEINDDGVSVDDVKTLLSLIHIEEHEGALSELHANEKEHQLRKCIRRMLKIATTAAWPSLQLFSGNRYGKVKVSGAVEDMPSIIRNAREKYNSLLKEKRRKAIEKRQSQEAHKSVKLANQMRSKALKRDYFLAMQILGIDT